MIKLFHQFIKESYKYVGNCINSFDNDGECLFNFYNDVSDFAYHIEEYYVEISKGEFLKNVINNYQFLNKNNIEYYYDTNKNIFVAYDVDKDIHYFFVKN